MKFKAVLETESRDAKNVASALDVDNIKLRELKVETGVEKDRIVTKIESSNINTMISTLDDIICCQIVAERTIT